MTPKNSSFAEKKRANTLIKSSGFLSVNSGSLLGKNKN
jgi:hypothetical protein